MGVLFIGLKPNAGIPNKRINLLSVAAGKISMFNFMLCLAQESLNLDHQILSLVNLVYGFSNENVSCINSYETPSSEVQELSFLRNSFKSTVGGTLMSNPAITSVGITLC